MDKRDEHFLGIWGVLTRAFSSSSDSVSSILGAAGSGGCEEEMSKVNGTGAGRDVEASAGTKFDTKRSGGGQVIEPGGGKEAAQEWTNRTLISHERTSVHFLVLPGSLLSITEITEYTYFSLI